MRQRGFFILRLPQARLKGSRKIKSPEIKSAPAHFISGFYAFVSHPVGEPKNAQAESPKARSRAQSCSGHRIFNQIAEMQ